MKEPKKEVVIGKTPSIIIGIFSLVIGLGMGIFCLVFIIVNANASATALLGIICSIPATIFGYKILFGRKNKAPKTHPPEESKRE